MSDASRSSKPFVRPSYNAIDRFFNQYLPPQPVGQRQYIAPEALRATRRDYWIVLRQFIISLAVFGLQIWLLHWTTQPPVVLLAKLFWQLQPMLGIGFEVLRWLIAVAILCAYVLNTAWRDNSLSINLATYGKRWPQALWLSYLDNTTSAIATEEQWYREGAEYWSPKQRRISNLVFGFSHVTTIFYPIASYLPLCLLGHTLNRIYLQELQRTGSHDEALTRTVVVHRLYNWSLLGMIVPYVLLLIALA